jgi:hypothetical protein
MRYVRTLGATLLLASATMAQVPSSDALIPVGTPTYLGVYSVAAQAFLPAPPPAGPQIVYDNTAFGGQFFQPGAGSSNMDWGTLAAAGHNDITTFQVGYGTTTMGTIDLVIALHAGATGFGDAGVISSLLVTGLPGSPDGIQAVANAFDILLPAPVKVLDGPMGYSYEPLDAGTGPLLVGPPNESGVIDAFDQYAGTGGAYVGSFFFGGSPLASFYCQLQGEEPECLLVIGEDKGSAVFKPGSHAWTTQVGTVEDHYETTMEDLPSFVLPPNGLGTSASLGSRGGPITKAVSPDWMDDKTFSVQVVMWNPTVFPGQPEQFTGGLKVTLKPDGTISTRPFGDSIGMQVWAETFVNQDGKKAIRFPFTIEGL